MSLPRWSALPLPLVVFSLSPLPWALVDMSHSHTYLALRPYLTFSVADNLLDWMSSILSFNATYATNKLHIFK